jgi:CRP/FNR family transcriptional regulator
MPIKGDGIMLVAQRSDALAHLPLFSSLSERELEALSVRVVERHFAPGEVLFREGEECRGLHVLAAGSVKIVRSSAAGREIAIHVESAPSTVAEIPLFDGGPYPATACAIDDVVCYVLDRDTFRALCAEHPDICPKILASVGRRLRKLVSLIESLSFGGVRQRLARMLLEFRDAAGDDTFTLPLTLQEMALRLGTVREVISRNMSRLQAHGVIRMRKREIVILDRHALLRDAEREF